jgi:hypothetical protein
MASLTTDAVTTAGTFLSEPSSTAFALGTPRTIAIGATSVNLALTTTCRFVSLITGAGTHIHFTIGTGAQTATSSSHYLKAGERIIVAVPPNANIAAIQGSASGTLFISELTD